MAPRRPRRIGELDCRLLAIEAGMAEAGMAEAGGADRLRQFVEHFACDVLIVR